MFYSQLGQDKILFEVFFKDVENGIFVDVGAHDGKTCSNTLFYEESLNWKGICIEPLPDVYNLLINNRKCLSLNYAICNENTDNKEFLELKGHSEMISGLLECYDQRHLQRVHREINEFGGSFKIIKVKTKMLKDILFDNNIEEIHYLSIDAEGAELDILKSIDFSKVFIHVLDIENNFSDTFYIIKNYLEDKGFTNCFSISFDEIFINNNSSLKNKLK